MKCLTMATPSGVALITGLALAWPSGTCVASCTAQPPKPTFVAEGHARRSANVILSEIDPDGMRSPLPYRTRDTEAMPFVSAKRRVAGPFKPASANVFVNLRGDHVKVYRVRMGYGVVYADLPNASPFPSLNMDVMQSRGHTSRSPSAVPAVAPPGTASTPAASGVVTRTTQE